MNGNEKATSSTRTENSDLVYEGHSSGNASANSCPISRPQRKDTATKEHPIEDVCKVIFLTGILFGIQSIRKNKEEVYEFNGRSLIPKAIGMMVVISWLISATTFSSSYTVPLWFTVTILPLGASLFFCVFIYTHSYYQVRSMIDYMNEINTLLVPHSWRPKVMYHVSLLTSIILTVCSVIMMPDELKWAAIGPCLLRYAIPVVVDLYLVILVRTILISMQRLYGKVSDVDVQWDSKHIHEVAEHWMLITRVVWKHNKIYSVIIHGRFIVLMFQMTANLFVLWGMERFSEDCCVLLIINFVPLCEVSLRLYAFCNLGEEIIYTSQRITRKLTTIMYEIPPATREHNALHILVSRMERNPTSISIWGMESVSSKTFISMTAIVLLYVLILFQFTSKANWQFTCKGDGAIQQVTKYSYCFNANATLEV